MSRGGTNIEKIGVPLDHICQKLRFCPLISKITMKMGGICSINIPPSLLCMQFYALSADFRTLTSFVIFIDIVMKPIKINCSQFEDHFEYKEV